MACAVVGAALALANGCGVQAADDEPVLQTNAEPLITVSSHTIHRTSALAGCGDCHGTHSGMGGYALLSFGTRAFAPGRPAPSYDSVTKRCSEVACHMVPAGVFSYYFQGGDGEPEFKSVSYGGVPVVTPVWNTSDGRGDCTACHNTPPTPVAGVWHSGQHGGPLNPQLNACALCHPDVVAVDGGIGLNPANTCGPNGTVGSCAALHRDGTVEVWAQFKRTCFNCH